MIILASGSPRRRELMGYIRTDFEVVTLPTSEDADPGLPPNELAKTLALRKAAAVAKLRPRDTVIGADTIVFLDGRIFGKPKDSAQAAEMLRALSGREHSVFTGVAIIRDGRSRVFCEETQVRFAELTDDEILTYTATNEPLDKAGAYGIQGRGALLVRGITGDFYNVMGLPLRRLSEELLRFL